MNSVTTAGDVYNETIKQYVENKKKILNRKQYRKNILIEIK